MVVRISDKTQNYSKVTKLLVKPIVLLSIFVFKEALAFIYGIVYTIVTSVALDLCTFVLKKCHLTYVDCEEDIK